MVPQVLLQAVTTPHPMLVVPFQTNCGVIMASRQLRQKRALTLFTAPSRTLVVGGRLLGGNVDGSSMYVVHAKNRQGEGG
jgi:hypothetical protein